MWIFFFRFLTQQYIIAIVNEIQSHRHITIQIANHIGGITYRSGVPIITIANGHSRLKAITFRNFITIHIRHIGIAKRNGTRAW
jgi:hypothetical protein